LFLLSGGQPTEFFGDLSGVARKDIFYQRRALGRQMNLGHPTIIGIFPPIDQRPLFEIIDNHRHIAAALENLEAEIALAQRPKMPKRFEHPELAKGQLVLSTQVLPNTPDN
jgi:hypothetical protein